LSARSGRDPDEFVARPAKENLRVFVEAARQRKEPRITACFIASGLARPPRPDISP